MLDDEEEELKVCAMAGWTKLGHFWPLTALGQVGTAPYDSEKDSYLATKTKRTKKMNLPLRE